MTDIVELAADETHPLRRTVLRDGTRSDVVEFDGDTDAGTFHLGVRVDGDLVAISTWLPRRHREHPTSRGYQLRGMATAPERRGHGDGSALLRAGLDRCRSAGAELVWARARTTAVEFYRRHGFEAVGPEYVDATTGLPHRDIVLFLSG